MRNGDVTPTRMDAQQDAIHLLCNAKLGQNPENTVGLLSLATIGRSPEALAAGSDGAAEAVGASTAATNGTSYGAGAHLLALGGDRGRAGRAGRTAKGPVGAEASSEQESAAAHRVLRGQSGGGQCGGAGARRAGVEEEQRGGGRDSVRQRGFGE
eukprot:ctg_341.g108